MSITNKSREQILSDVRGALIKHTEAPKVNIKNTEVFSREEGLSDLDIFKKRFLATKAECFDVTSIKEIPATLKKIADAKRSKEIFCFEKDLAEYFVSIPEYCQTSDENLNSAKLSLTSCEKLIARTGSILISSANASGRRLSVFPPIHVVIAKTSQLVYDIEDGLRFIKDTYKPFPSMVSMITGPSRTADIEKTLVLGAHGPKELILILLHDNN